MDEAWAVVLEQPKSAEDQQVDNLVSDFKRELVKVGGVKAFISKRLAQPSDKAGFLEYLQSTGPLRKPDHVTYQTTRPMPYWSEGTREELVLHLSDFCWSDLASLQLNPEISKSCELIDRYAKEGFITCNEPILVSVARMPRGDDGPAFSVGFVKGQSRVLTLMAFQLYCFGHDQPMPDIISESAVKLYCRHLDLKDDQAEVFEAFKMGHRSAVRKAPHVIQWVWSLLKLTKMSGISAVSVVAAWNKQNPKDDQVLRKKAMSTSNVLTFPEESRQIIMQA